MDTAAYLKRINFSGDLSPNLEVLERLQRHHLLHVPFENLDIHYGRLIELDLAQFYKKIVQERRGGFCYELNGLFNYLLSTIGFKTRIISARVFNDKKGTFGQEYDHLAIIVELNQAEYLVDVGFGEFAFKPLIIVPDQIQEDPRGRFMIEKEEDNYIVLKVNGSSKSNEYKFSPNTRALSDFQGMCTYQQTSPNSHFTHKKLITRPTNNGRITLSGNTLKITEGGVVPKEMEVPEEAYAEQLQQWFQIDELKLKTMNQS